MLVDQRKDALYKDLVSVSVFLLTVIEFMKAPLVYGVREEAQFCFLHSTAFEYFLTVAPIAELLQNYDMFVLQHFPRFKYVSPAVASFTARFEMIAKHASASLFDYFTNEDIQALEDLIHHVLSCFGDLRNAEQFYQPCEDWLKVNDF